MVFLEFKAVEPKAPIARFFCAYCGRPKRMRDDDLDEILSMSDFCRCARRGRC